MQVVCGIKNCKYNGGTFCTKDYVMLTPMGQCKEYWWNNGQPRPMPKFAEMPVSEEPVETPTTEEPAVENTEPDFAPEVSSVEEIAEPEVPAADEQLLPQKEG